jgi:uncharacterized membrane protein YgdD (TMEM256/DUF423 family)
MNRTLLLTGLALITLSIILGAFGAHGLKSIVSAERVQSFETGVRYQMYLGLAYVSLHSLAKVSLKWFFLLTLSGILLFSLSIYLLALQDVFGVSLRFLGPVTPLGGLLLIAGFFILLIQLLGVRKTN